MCRYKSYNSMSLIAFLPPRLSERNTMELLEEDLTCPICCCLFDDPRVLSCSHSFCKKCLEGILDGNRSTQWRPPFKCPSCRKETQHNGINSIQTNYTLRGIVEKYNKIRILPRMSICKQHCGQPLNIFCLTDLKLICGFCATTGDHKGHKFCALEDAYEQEKRAFDELLQGVETWRSADTLSCLETLEASKKKALQLVSRDADKVKDYFEKLISALDHKKSEILSDFETLKLVVMQAYDPEINKLSAALDEQRRALNIAESFRNVTDPLCFLQQMQEFREKLRVVRETPLPSRTDMDVGPLVRNFDVKNWDSVKFKDVDKLSVPHENGSYRCKTKRVRGRSWGELALYICFLILTPLVFFQADNLAVSPLFSFLNYAYEATPLVLIPLAQNLLVYLMDTCQNCYLYLIHTTADILAYCKLL
ncbi:tripartite motif-containing 13 isoform X1 [Hypomesus transpacificus]|uniref:tripartite motif-containing 13 isoform X1 n=2 Tax=Hypomesus transpacificus TaxID=137520 RepID=UPI001F0738B0|nr:tripartite motif-containing 13 isoform X1 [Hypomesus transpacificus]